MSSITISVDGGNHRPFNHFHAAVGYANADFTYTPPTMKMYDHLSSYHKHPVYMRLHNILTLHGKGDYYLLHEQSNYGNPKARENKADIVVSLDKNGNVSYNWEYVDKVYDLMVEHSMRPIVETVYMPSCLQEKGAPLNGPPNNYRLWREVIREFVHHVIERYGKEEIEKWYFEVWNEPTWPFRRNYHEFFALYDYMVDGVLSVADTLQVGGPATMQGEADFVLFEQFLEHCSNGVNYATGRFGTRIDFLSVHCKGGTPAGNCPSNDVIFNSIRKYAEILERYPQYKSTPFFNDESDIIWHGNKGVETKNWLNFRNTHYFPGFVCKMVSTYCSVVEDELGLNLQIVDSDNCHTQWERRLFSGNRSQMTPLITYPSTDLLRKSAFNAYVLLSRLGNRRFMASCDNDDFGRKFGVLPTADNESLALMVWNFEDGMDDDVNERTFQIDISNLPFSGDYTLLHYRIDCKHSSAYAVWKELGFPKEPTVEQIKKIRENENLTLFEPVTSLSLEESHSFGITLPMHAVTLLLLVPSNSSAPRVPAWKKAVSEKGYNGNAQVFLKWKPNEEKDFLCYTIERKEGSGNYEQIVSDTKCNTAVYTDMSVKKGSRYTYRIRSVNASVIASEWSEEREVAV